MSSYVFAVAGAKGGVGKTTTSINLATALAERGWSAVVVETDVAMANVLDFLHVDVDPYVEATLHDVLRADAAVEDAIYEAPGDIDVLPSGIDLEGFAAADVRSLSEAVQALRDSYDVIIMDTGAGLSLETLYPPALADGTILVSSPRVASVRDTEKTRRLTDQVGGTVEGVVFVESGTGTAPPGETIADFLGVELLGQIPEDAVVPVSQDAGEPVVSYAERSSAAEAYRDLGESVEWTVLERVTSEDEESDESDSAAPDTPFEVEASNESPTRDGVADSGDGFEAVVEEDEALVEETTLGDVGIDETALSADPPGNEVGDTISDLWESAVLEADGGVARPPADAAVRMPEPPEPDASVGHAGDAEVAEESSFAWEGEESVDGTQGEESSTVGSRLRRIVRGLLPGGSA